MTDPLLIVGSGLGGYSLAREWRKLSPNAPLTIVTEDEGGFYSKPLLSNALAKNKTPAQLVTASAEKMADDLRATIITQTRVTDIDAQQRKVKLADGTILPYADLVLAVGATPRSLAIDPRLAERVVSVNNLADYTRFRELLRPGMQLTIVGPGLIGCEFANDLITQDYRVQVIGPDAAPLSRLLPPEMATVLRDKLSDLGVDWYLGQRLRQIEDSDKHCAIWLENGVHLESDLVLSAIGLQPNLDLAHVAGLNTHHGISVDRLLQSSDPHIFALGDCAEVEGLVLPFVMPLMTQARALASTLSGTPTPLHYGPMPVVVKTPAWPLVISPPSPTAQGEWQLDGVDNGMIGRFMDSEQRLLGMALGGTAIREKTRITAELPPVLD